METKGKLTEKIEQPAPTMKQKYAKYFKEMEKKKWENTVIIELTRLAVQTPPNHWVQQFLRDTIRKLRKGQDAYIQN